MKKWGTSNRQALLLVLIATIIFSTEAIVLRLAAKHGLQMGQIAVAQCAAAAATQFLFGAKISKVALKNWWLPLLMAAGSGLAFYLAIRTAPAAIVALIEPLGLIPLAIGHRVLLKKTISTGTIISLLMLLLSSIVTVGQWPEKIGLFAFLVSFAGIIFSGLSLVTAEVVNSKDVPSFVFAVQLILICLSAVVGATLQATSLGGDSSKFMSAILVGLPLGIFIGFAVSAVYYGVSKLGALQVGIIRMLRLPTIAILGYLFLAESSTLISGVGLASVMLFSTLAVRFNQVDEVINYEDLPARR